MIGISKHFFAFYIFIFLFACSNGHKNIIISNENGIRKEVKTIEYGTGGGITGSAPELTKKTIKKYDRNNKVFYYSEKEIHLNGCFYSIPVWRVFTTDSLGISKEYSVKKNIAIIRIIDANNNVIGYKTQERSNFILPDWFDSEEND